MRQITPTIKKSKQITFYDLANTLRRKKWLLMLCLCGVLAPIVYYNQTTAPVYEAETSIVFEEAREVMPAFDFSGAISRKSFITNQIEEIKSRTLSEEVAIALPLTVTEQFNIPNPLPPGFTREKLVARRIRKKISAEPVRDADIIKVKVQATDPVSAASIANTVSDVLKKRRLKVKREEISGVREFIKAQLKIVGEQLLNAEQALKDYKEENKVTYLDQESKEILRRMTEAEVLYNQAKADRQQTDQRLSYVHRKIAEQRQAIVPSITDITSPWAQQLKQQLVDLEVQHTTLLVQDYAEDHPQVAKLKEQIEHTRRCLSEEMLKIAEGQNIIEPLSQIEDFLKESVSLGVDFHTYRARESALRKIVDGYDKKLQALPEKELQLAQLTRAREVNNKTYMMLLEKGEEARITEAAKISDIRVIDPAEPPELPVKPKKTLNLILGIIVGLTVGVGLAFFTESLDTSLKTGEDVERATGLPTLGLIPTIKEKGRFKDETARLAAHLVSSHGPKSAAAEAYRSLRTNMQFTGPDKSLETLLITSAGPKEGKTLTVANLGITAAQFGAKTLLIDSDLRRPMLHRLFGISKEPGLTDVLIESAELHATIHQTEVQNLWVLTCGTLPPDPAELLASQKMKQLLLQLRGEFHTIILDSPPVIAVTDAVVLGTEVDGVAMVIRSGEASEDGVLRAKTLLENVNAKIFGAILNNVHVENLYGRYGYYYRYSYYYTHEGKKVSKRERKRKT